MPRAGAKPRKDLVSSSWAALKTQAKDTYPWVCHRCKGVIPRDVHHNHRDAWTLDHLAPASVAGTTIPTLDQVRPAHRRCNSSHGASLGNAMRKRRTPALTVVPDIAPVLPTEDWMQRLADEMGEHDVWPRVMTPVHPDATGTYGFDVIERIEKRRAADPLVPTWEKSLRWFQRLLIVRAYEHDKDGRLVWQYVLQSSNRQVGKSVGVREVLTDRTIHGHEMFGEEQLILHVARDLQVAEEVQLPIRLWAEGQPDMKPINTNGKTAFVAPHGRWLVRSEKGLYGYSASVGCVDECWDVSRKAVSAGIQKTMAAREQPQLWMLSTAHADATDLFPSWRHKAITEMSAPRKTLLVEWSADPTLKSTDEEAWKQASPYYDDTRREMIAEDVGTPDFDEQWLNRWPPYLNTDDASSWLNLTGLEDKDPVPTGPVLAAVERDRGGSWAVAWGWKVGDEVHVRVEPAGKDPDRAFALAQSQHPGLVAMHRSTRALRAEWPWPVQPMTATEYVAATQSLRHAVDSKRLRWTGNELPRQMLHAVVAPRDGGLVVDTSKSRGPVNAVLAVAWTVWMLERQPVETGGIF